MWAIRLVDSARNRVNQRRQRHQTFQQERRDPRIPSIQIIDAETPSPEEPSSSEELRMPLLFNLCRRWAWPAVEFRCQSHPHEAEVQDERGDTCLHWAVFGNPPLGAVEAILTASPDLASVANRQGLLPLHVAAMYRASGDVIRILVQAHPKAAGIRALNSKSMPLHLMCEAGTTVDGIHAILETPEGSASVFKRDGVFRQTPLYILNSRKNLTKYHQILLEMGRDVRTHRETLDRYRNHVESARTWDFWRKACLLIYSEYKGAPLEPEEDVTRGIVHACVSIQRCPPSLLDLALLLYPHQLLETDNSGQVPLHKAVTKGEVTILHDVLFACTEAAKIADNDGRYPLHIAADSGHRWANGLRDLFKANPSAVEGLDLDERFYPRLWSKLTRIQGGETALFLSLVAKPDILLRR